MLAWLRLTPRLQPQDILDRIEPAAMLKNCKSMDGALNALNMRRKRFRDAFHMYSWSASSRENVTKVKDSIEEELQARGIDLARNSTRGLAAGLVDPSAGPDSARIAIPSSCFGRNNGHDPVRGPPPPPTQAHLISKQPLNMGFSGDTSHPTRMAQRPRRWSSRSESEDEEKELFMLTPSVQAPPSSWSANGRRPTIDPSTSGVYQQFNQSNASGAIENTRSSTYQEADEGLTASVSPKYTTEDHLYRPHLWRSRMSFVENLDDQAGHGIPGETRYGFMEMLQADQVLDYARQIFDNTNKRNQ